MKIPSLLPANRTILDLCGGTGAWSQPYVDAGYDVHIITQPQADVRLYKYSGQVHGILAAPPCTHLAASGARWWKNKGIDSLLDALSVVDACLRIITVCQPVWWVLENPVGRLRQYLGPPELIFNPCDYGDPWTKKTLLWGKFNKPRLRPVKPTRGSMMHKLPNTKKRSVLRSVTPPGFAKLFFEANP